MLKLKRETQEREVPGKSAFPSTISGRPQSKNRRRLVEGDF